MPSNLTFSDFLLFGIIIWLIVLSYQLLKTLGHYRKITMGAKQINLEKILEDLTLNLENDKKYISEISHSLIATQKQIEGHVQKLALIRFNPFEDSGGDQSFCLALLDGNNNGVVISSLHSRSGTRVYTKSVRAGKAHTHAFTHEEKETIEKALKQGKIEKGT